MTIGSRKLLELPKGWIWTTVGEISDSIQYGYTAKGTSKVIGPKFLRITDIQNDSVDWNTVPYCRIAEHETQRYLLSPNDLVFARTGATVGKSFLIGGNVPRAVFASYLIRIVFNCHLNTKFVYVFFHSYNYWLQIYQGQLGIGQPNVNSKTLARIRIPLAPFPEQKRIVAKIEELFTRLDAGVEALKKVKAELKRYRQAVLKYAFEGKLTAEWRKKNKDRLEPASKLLERIAKERERNGKSKVKKLMPLDTSNLPELPEGWEWTRMSVVCSKIQDGTHFSPKIQYTQGGDGRFMYVTAKNIRENGLDLGDITYVDEYFHRQIYSRCNPEKGDVLLTKDGVKTGTTVINTVDGEFSLLSSVAILKPVIDVVLAKYIKHFIHSPLGFKLITGQMTGTAIKRIILARIKTSPLSLAPAKEQEAIVAEIDRHFSIADEVEQTIEKSLKESERLRQSILKRAFEGKLVPQDPADEPAEKLLERINAEKQNHRRERKVKKRAGTSKLKALRTDK